MEDDFDDELDTLKAMLTDDFLYTLRAVAEYDGHSTDWMVIQDFVQNVHHLAGKPLRPLIPREP